MVDKSMQIFKCLVMVFFLFQFACAEKQIGDSYTNKEEKTSNQGDGQNQPQNDPPLPLPPAGINAGVIIDDAIILPPDGPVLPIYGAGGSGGRSPHRAECGNHRVESGEECDDGNRRDGDGCSRLCRLESSCGDGLISPNEQCDPEASPIGCAEGQICVDCICIVGCSNNSECNDNNPCTVDICDIDTGLCHHDNGINECSSERDCGFDQICDLRTCSCEEATAASDLGIVKTATSPASPGQVLTYTVTVTNNGPDAANNVVITDTLPLDVSFVSAAGCTNTGALVICDIPSLANGSSQNFSIVVRVNTDASGALRNAVNVRSDSFDDDSDNDNYTLDTIITYPPADLALLKTANALVATVGQEVTLNLLVRNLSLNQASLIHVTDPLPSGVTFVSASVGCSYNDVTRIVTCETASLASLTSVLFQIQVTINSGTSGQIITNEAFVTSGNDPIPLNNSSLALITVIGVPVTSADLAVTKVGNNNPVNPGDTLVYTITVTNNGPDLAAGITITDILPLGTTFVSASGCSYNILLHTLTCSGGSLAASASEQIIITVAINDVFEALPLVNTAMAYSATTFDPNLSNNVALATTDVDLSVADLAISKTGLPNPVDAGSNLTYTLSVHNNGPDSSTSIIVVDTLPTGVSFISASPGCTNLLGVVTCTSASLANGGDLSFTIVTGANAPGGLPVTNVATVSSADIDPNPLNNLVTINTNVNTSVLSADLAITKTDAPDPVDVGGTLTYTLTVINNGPDTATAVSVLDTLPAGVTFVSATSPACIYNALLHNVVCASASLANGGSENFTITVTPNPPGGLPVINEAVVSSATLDPNNLNNTATATTAVNLAPVADLSIGKFASANPVNPGDNLTYTLVVTNNGPDAAPSFIITDPLLNGSTFVSSTSACSVALGVVTCTSAGALAANQSIVLSFTVNVGSSILPLPNTATVSTTTAFDNNSLNNSSTATTSINAVPQPEADLAIVKTGSANPVNVGDSLTYTLVVTNNGPDAAPSFVVSDFLHAGSTFVSADVGCVNALGLVTCTSITPLAANATQSFTITINVDALAEPSLSNTADVDSTTSVDLIPNNNSSQISTTVNAAPLQAKRALSKIANDADANIVVVMP